MSADDTAAAIRSIYEKYRPAFDERCGAIEDAVVAALEGRFDDAVATEGRRQSHKLAGAGGTFGLPTVSIVAAELERGFLEPRPADASWIDRMSELTGALRAALDAGPEDAASEVDGPGATGREESGASRETEEANEIEATDGPSLLVVAPDDTTSSDIAREARHDGFRVRWSDRRIDADPRPDVAVVNGGGEDSAVDLLEVLGSLTDGDRPVPTIVLTPPDGRIDRVEVARHGGRGFLTTPVEPRRVVQAARDLLEADRLEGITILAVDDDPAVLEMIHSLFDADGVEVETLSDPGRFWEVLARTVPDQLVLDVDMPGISGIDLCRAVRNDPQWSHLSVLFLTARTDARVVEEVFEAGADDYVAKPINHRELVTRISNRLDRFRLYRRLAETDPLTDTANRRKAMIVLDRLQALSHRFDQAFSVAVLDLDRFKTVNDAHGHMAGDEVLRSVGRRLMDTFRGEDLVARWGGGEFLVGMYGMRDVDAVSRLADVLEAQREVVYTDDAGERFTVTFSAGVAEHGVDGDDVSDLFRAADRAVRAAKRAGRDRVFDVARAEATTRIDHVDVVVVDDDDALTSILLHAFQTRGWRARRIADGAAAVTLLADDPIELRADVVVLDWDLPGLDGPAVLRRLAVAGRLADTTVIMLTAHGREEEVLRTLEMGADDHVAKPFSVPVLMQRIRHALDR